MRGHRGSVIINATYPQVSGSLVRSAEEPPDCIYLDRVFPPGGSVLLTGVAAGTASNKATSPGVTRPSKAVPALSQGEAATHREPGPRSTTRTRFPRSARVLAGVMTVVVLPVPPAALNTVMWCISDTRPLAEPGEA